MVSKKLFIGKMEYINRRLDHNANRLQDLKKDIAALQRLRDALVKPDESPD